MQLPDSLRQRAVWYYYGVVKFNGEYQHTFTTCKDELDCESLFVKRITTEYPGRLWAYVRQYAKNTGDNIFISNDRYSEQWINGELTDQRSW